MVNSIKKLESLILQVSDYIKNGSEEELAMKSNPEKWSKKEILGHLVDSGLYNLQRFTSIQFEAKPYRLKAYKQDELIEANNYQSAKTKDILDLLVAINKRIVGVITHLKDEMLNYEIETSEKVKFDLNYLIEDYVIHFEHHTKQIIE